MLVVDVAVFACIAVHPLSPSTSLPPPTGPTPLSVGQLFTKVSVISMRVFPASIFVGWQAGGWLAR